MAGPPTPRLPAPGPRPPARLVTGARVTGPAGPEAHGLSGAPRPGARGCLGGPSGLEIKPTTRHQATTSSRATPTSPSLSLPPPRLPNQFGEGGKKPALACLLRCVRGGRRGRLRRGTKRRGLVRFPSSLPPMSDRASCAAWLGRDSCSV